jgi:hypothetical protein
VRKIFELDNFNENITILFKLLQKFKIKNFVEIYKVFFEIGQFSSKLTKIRKLKIFSKILIFSNILTFAHKFENFLKFCEIFKFFLKICNLFLKFVMCCVFC